LLAARNNVPAVYSLSVFARDGGLLSYGPDAVDIFRRSASYVDRILRGANSESQHVGCPSSIGATPVPRRNARERKIHQDADNLEGVFAMARYPDIVVHFLTLPDAEISALGYWFGAKPAAQALSHSLAADGLAEFASRRSCSGSRPTPAFGCAKEWT
jgi:hypothetical protein